MKKVIKNIKFLYIPLILSILISCGTVSKVPLTGRKHRIGVSDSEILSLSCREYRNFMMKAKLSDDIHNVQMVRNVGNRLATAVENYLRNNGYAKELKNFQWEFNLIASKQVNAFCMPGGKIVVYEGLLPYTQNEAALAIVLGHEIAHAVAKHSAEQLTKLRNQGFFTQLAGSVLNSTVGQGIGDVTSQIAGIYFSFRNLKYSRDNESEADHMGLVFAAMAGYDPHYAIQFWQRMAVKSNNSTDDFFSDHPSDIKRIEHLKQLMPEAMKYYQAISYNNRKYSNPTFRINKSKKKIRY